MSRFGYVTEESIRSRVAESLYRKRKATNKDLKPGDVESELASAEYQKWIADRIEDARTQGRLLTLQQLRDVEARRIFQVGDTVRYVGANTANMSPATGRYVTLEKGQVGTISRAERNGVFTFMPHVPRDVVAMAEAVDIEVLTITTSRWMDFERVV